MSANIIVTGLPADIPFRKLMYTFKGMFKRIKIIKFWIRELSAMHGVDEKQMTIEFDTDSEARKARNFLDNYPFSHPVTKQEYVLSAHIDESLMQPEEYEDILWEGDRRPRQTRRERQRARVRSPSPGYRSEASKLDLEIELLRKQRQVIEEERRLLLERKKLDMIREYGPSSSRDYMVYDEPEPPRKRRLPPPPVEVKKPRKRSPPPPKQIAPRNTNTLPVFFQPCKKLLNDMRELIDQDSTPEEKEILIKLIRAALRKNLAIALEGREYMATGEIIKLYRELHPKTEDEAFVKKILANIRASYLPNELESKLAKVKNEPKEMGNKTRKNPSHDTTKGNEEKQEANETESQDKPANGDNNTDADTDFTVDVTAEPISRKPMNTVKAANKEDLPEAETATTDKSDTVEESTGVESTAPSDKPDAVEQLTGVESSAPSVKPDAVEESTGVERTATSDKPDAVEESTGVESTATSDKPDAVEESTGVESTATSDKPDAVEESTGVESSAPSDKPDAVEESTGVESTATSDKPDAVEESTGAKDEVTTDDPRKTEGNAESQKAESDI